MIYQSSGSRGARTHYRGTLTMEIFLQSPDYRAQKGVSEMFCVESDVGMVGGYSGDIGEKHSCGEKHLRAKKNRVDEMDHVGLEVDDALKGRRGQEIPFQFGIEKQRKTGGSTHRKSGVGSLLRVRQK
jgi:hypothetical protein